MAETQGTNGTRRALLELTKRRITTTEIESKVRGLACRMNNGSWTLFFAPSFSPTGKRKAQSLGHSDPEAALRTLIEHEQKLTEGAHFSELPIVSRRAEQREALTVREAVKLYLDAHKGTTLDTREEYRSRLDRWVTGRDARGTAPAISAPSIGLLPVTKVTRNDVKAVLTQVRGTKNKYGRLNSRNTAHAVRVAIMALFSWLIDAEMLKDRDGRALPNPAARLGKHTKDAEADRNVERDGGVPFAFVEQELLLAALRKRGWAYPFVLLAFRAGLRIGEIAALQLDDIDLDAGTVHVRRHVTKKAGVVKNTKNKRGDKFVSREVPVNLDDELPVVLRAHIKARREQNLREGWGDRSPWLFVNRTGNLFGPGEFREAIWRPALREASIKRHTFHDTRTTFATELLYATNGNIQYVAQCLGDTLAVAAKSYAKVLDELKPKFPGALSRTNPALQRCGA
jgi:integrase